MTKSVCRNILAFGVESRFISGMNTTRFAVIKFVPSVWTIVKRKRRGTDMEEKKLTDEQIITAYKYCVIDNVDCKDCPCKDWGCAVHKKDIYDLLNRQKDKIDEYERKFDDGELVSKDWHDEQVLHDKAEIERLTEKVENQKAVIKGQNKTIEKEKAENKRLYNEYVRLDDFCAGKGCICCVCENKKTCNECKTCGSLATEKCNNFKIDVSKYTMAIERAGKLQKQVDELTSQNEWLKNENDYLKKCADAFLADYKNAVKDTAKEIYSEIGESDILVITTQEYGGIEVVSIERLKEIIKSKGVEVE